MSNYLDQHDLDAILSSYFSDGLIDHINIIHKYHDNTVSYYCNNMEWINHYKSQNYPSIGFFETKLFDRSISYILWDSLDSSDPILQDSYGMLGLLYGITTIKQTPNSTIYFNMGQKNSDKSILVKYMLNLEKILSFIDHFMSIVNITSKNIFEERYFISSNLSSELSRCNDVNRSNINKIKLLKYAVTCSTKQGRYEYCNDLLAKLSVRELESLFFLISGYSHKEIARELCISTSSIKTYLCRVNQKLDFGNNASLIKNCTQNDFRNTLLQYIHNI
jgi:DNA-binding CsgD family transcriptional regulator